MLNLNDRLLSQYFQPKLYNWQGIGFSDQFLLIDGYKTSLDLTPMTFFLLDKDVKCQTTVFIYSRLGEIIEKRIYTDLHLRPNANLELSSGNNKEKMTATVFHKLDSKEKDAPVFVERGTVIYENKKSTNTHIVHGNLEARRLCIDGNKPQDKSNIRKSPFTHKYKVPYPITPNQTAGTDEEIEFVIINPIDGKLRVILELDNFNESSIINPKMHHKDSICLGPRQIYSYRVRKNSLRGKYYLAVSSRLQLLRPLILRYRNNKLIEVLHS